MARAETAGVPSGAASPDAAPAGEATDATAPAAELTGATRGGPAVELTGATRGGPAAELTGATRGGPAAELTGATRGGPALDDPRARFLDGYARMLLIRSFESAMHRLFLAGEIHGTTHLYTGQEAVAVGTCMALRPDDYVAGTYRGHGHALAKGTSPEPLAAEMLGRATGVCGGRAGSMNVIDLEQGLIGCYGIVGGSIAACLGAALSASGQGRVAVAFFGDGAANQGYFHECLNMARVFSLPAVFVCENNFYGEFTPMATVTAGAAIARRGAGYDIPSAVIDGNDLWAVHTAASEAVEHARGGGGPTLLECQTYRQYGHSKSDPAPYRPKEELERWLARDPLKLARARLIEEGVSEAAIAAVEDSTEALLEKAIQNALAAPYPDPQTQTASEYSP